MENDKDNLTQEEFKQNWEQILKRAGRRWAITIIALVGCIGISKFLEKQWSKNTMYPQRTTIWEIVEDTSSAIQDSTIIESNTIQSTQQTTQLPNIPLAKKDTTYFWPQGVTVRPITEDTSSAISDTLQYDRQTK